MNEFVLCVENEGDSESLELWKIYRRLAPTPTEEEEKLIRVIDESGEDYLYPASFFVPITVPLDALKRLSMAS
ncbi:MAG: hypothetical protein ABI383_08810 [Acidobacteriaceae bacterium]